MNVESETKSPDMNNLFEYVKFKLSERLAFLEENVRNHRERRIEDVRRGIRSLNIWRELFEQKLLDSGSIIENVRSLIHKLLKP